MNIETISINMMAKHMNHATTSGVTKIQLDKKNMYAEVLKYIDDHCNKNGFEVLNFAVDGNAHYYALVKK